MYARFTLSVSRIAYFVYQVRQAYFPCATRVFYYTLPRIESPGSGGRLR